MLKHLSINEMVSLTAPWLDNATRKAAFLSIPEIAGLYPKIAPLQAELRKAQPVAREPSPALQAIIAAALGADGVHDALARAVSSGIVADRDLAMADKPPSLARARQSERVRSTLFPQGLSIINASHLAESGNTARVDTLLDEQPEIAEYLEAIPVQKAGTLLVVTQRWIASGKKLAKLEQEREELEAEEATEAPTREAINRLRARWIQLVSKVLSLLDLSDASPKAIASIRGPVRKASARAASRYDEGGEQGLGDELTDAEDDDLDDDLDALGDEADELDADDDEETAA